MQSTIRKMLFIIIVCSALAALLWYFPSFHIAPNDPIFIGNVYSCGVFLTALSLFFIPGLSFAIEALILQVLISVPILSKIWLSFYIYIESEHFYIEIGYIECWLYIAAYLLISMLQYGRGTSREAEKGKINRMNAPNKLVCKCCGEALFHQDVFCANCQTINPRVKAMLDAHPNRPPLDYQPLSGENRLRCPHCKASYPGPGPIEFTTWSPIIGCESCHNFFIDDTLIEWSLSSQSRKSRLIIGKPLTITVVLFLSYGYCTGCSNYGLYPFLVLMYLFCRALLFRTVHYREIQNSILRLKRNPEYPKILIDMDYGKYMDKRYQSSMRFKPSSWLDIIKDAFSFH